MALCLSTLNHSGFKTYPEKHSFYLYFNQELILFAHVSKITDADDVDINKVKFIDSLNAGIWSRTEKFFIS